MPPRLKADAGAANVPGAVQHRDPGCAALKAEVKEVAVVERERQIAAIVPAAEVAIGKPKRRVFPKFWTLSPYTARSLTLPGGWTPG
jgi:hypothetical protein